MEVKGKKEEEQIEEVPRDLVTHRDTAFRFTILQLDLL
jgi:hypothetical protein